MPDSDRGLHASLLSPTDISIPIQFKLSFASEPFFPIPCREVLYFLGTLFYLGDNAISYWPVFPVKDTTRERIALFLVPSAVVNMGPFSVLAIFTFPEKICYPTYFSTGMSKNLPSCLLFHLLGPAEPGITDAWIERVTLPLSISKQVINWYLLYFGKVQ